MAKCGSINEGKFCLGVLLILLAVQMSHCVIVFQQPKGFGTMQIQLSTTSGFISTSTSNTFTFANPGYDNITSLGLALCGYDVPTPTTLQFRAEASYDTVANSIVVLILPLNTTRLAFINYYVIITTQEVQSFLIVQNTCLQPLNPSNASNFGSTQSYTIASPFVSNSSSTVTGIPYIRSVNNIVANSFNFVQIYGITSLPATGQFNITLMNNFNYQSEVCLSVVCYWNSIGLTKNLLNISYSNNFLVVDSSSLTQNLAAVSQLNFTINNIYGPVFNRKCLVGFQGFKMSSSLRQTLSFNLTGNGIYGIVSSSNNSNLYSWFCMAQITCQGSLAQYYPAINDCEQICSVLNCTVCQTSTSCSQCNTGFYINSLFRCSNCISNCNNCTNSKNCTLCATGYYYNSTACIPCAQFCNACNSVSCTSCQYGYYANGRQCVKCSSVLPFCQYCATGTYCSTCPSGYYPTGSTQGCVLCSKAQAGCSTCGSASYCTTCQPNFYLSGNLCKACVFNIASCCPSIISNCSLCKSASVCGSCMMGFYLSNSNQTCSPCVATLTGCLTCTNATTCTLCNTTSFINAQNQCITCSSSISQCTTCANSTYCTLCQLPFIMVNGSCLNCPIWPMNNLYYLDANNICQPCSTITSNCILCSPQQVCLQCIDLYYLSSGTCNLCSDAITNCVSCFSDTHCSICIPGYYPDNYTSCSPCSSVVSHCTTCSQAVQASTNTSSVVCMNCEAEYYLNSSECTPCKQTISFCLTCQNNYQCTVCQQGYFLSSTLTCITCIQLIIGCTSCKSSSICLNCTAGYYLINNYCTQCKMAINNCYSCGQINSTLTCSNCLPGYYLGFNFTCYLCNSTLQFCSTCSSSTTCTSCISGYVVNYNKTCSLCDYLISNCEYCSSTKCLKCLPNFIIDVYGDCQSCSKYISGCQTCAYYLNSSTLQSQLNCTNCFDGYIQYMSGSIAKCIACNASIPNCISCVNLTSCSACNNVSFLNSKNTCSLCSIYLPNCVYCNSSNACQSCSGTYYLTSNLTCEYCDPSQFGNDGTVLKLSLCLSCRYIAKTATCLTCIQGYFAFQNGCSSCKGKIANCISCTTSTFCIACESGYYLSSTNTQCINCPIQLAYCSTCDLAGLCQQCESDCYLNATLNQCIKCFQITFGCNSCTNNGTCVTCADGYYMSGSSCISCSDVIANCLLCASSSACSLYSTNYTDTVVSSSFLTSINSNIWMYIAIGCTGSILLAILICILWKRYKSNQEVPSNNEIQSATKSHTDRELHMSESTQANELQISHGQLCQHCKSHKFDVMNIQLLCSVCELKKKENKDHFIRKDITQKRRKKKQEIGLESKINPNNKKLERESKSKGRSRQIKQSSQSSKKSSNDDEQLVRSNEKKPQANGQPSLRYTESEYFDPEENSKRNKKDTRKVSKSHL